MNLKFSEKIQKLRKKHNLTQEEFANRLFISRTAISKWESDKGYPSIDLLKRISEEFNVSIDALLSSDQILELAVLDKKQKIVKNYNFIFSMLDLMIIFLVFLPLYGMKVDNYVYSVTLFSNNDIFSYIKIIYLVSYSVLFVVGVIEAVSCFFDNYKIQNMLNIFSLLLHFLIVFFLIMTKEPYACAFTFILLIAKLVLYVYRKRN